MTIIRRHHNSNFTVIPNAIFEDSRLSIEAKGALGYLLSRPHDWLVRLTYLGRALSIGRDKMERIIGELLSSSAPSPRCARNGTGRRRALPISTSRSRQRRAEPTNRYRSSRSQDSNPSRLPMSFQGLKAASAIQSSKSREDTAHP
jgi:hypothetical protein